jgi:hypothetical protein
LRAFQLAERAADGVSTGSDISGFAPKRAFTATASPAPMSSAMKKPGTLDGAMPAKLSLNMRPNAAAGFANDVEAVN